VFTTIGRRSEHAARIAGERTGELVAPLAIREEQIRPQRD
jgi:hypothetical protein